MKNFAVINIFFFSCHRACVYTVLQIVQKPGVCCAVYGSVHYKEPLKSFEKSRALSRLRASFCRDIATIVQIVLYMCCVDSC